MAATETYTLEQAEEDIADLRGQVSLLGEYQTVGGITIDGTVNKITAGSVTIDGTANTVTVDTWHSFTPAAGTGSRCAYRLTAQGDLQLTGSITYSAPTSPTSIFTLPSGYYSTVNSYGPIPLGCNTSAYASGAARITLSNAGLLQYFGPSSAGTITMDGVTFPISNG